ncbi:GDP-mannose 4,6-dehydratase [Mucilaginibacter myungsuensis]|uniref:GDP-mannose 4,6-dehydratase n=1 Tax=Mucilaginibacter myungsuensis TaxID=649104 RepID=A0A929L380_9SPHI|nr:GDP-mannose 4,6-dehydratase [Mucilaginibacter myungsuensis]MBE9662416.1 GDP-mannose 4,6-dehydratase [Mucilaginibacter myungsuensis]MDN3599147.1 GDP-mannose 4,6-dehydratase [Mucilaginibacter myungsuensis]
MRYLITGGCGFLGSNLAAEILKKGDELFVFDNLYRTGTEQNLKWLQSLGTFKFYHSDIRSYNDVEYAVRDAKPDVVFHLAGQVAMTTSLDNPRFDFEVNVLGGNNVLEAVRKYAPEAIVTYSSTNKVYGDLEWIEYEETPTRFKAVGYDNGFDEKVQLDFQSPYGCSKGATDQYMLDYAKMFGLRTVVFRHSSIFGGRQYATADQGWIGWFVKQAIDIKSGLLKEPFTISGTGKQVRDVLFGNDLIACYFAALENINITQGKAYNIGGGMRNSLSLLELFDFLERELSIEMKFNRLPVRQSDQRVYVADISKAQADFGWQPKITKDEGLRKMVGWVSSL